MNVKTVRYGTDQAAREFTESLRETGFAVITHHPISAELIKETFAEWGRFFASDSKFQYTFDPSKQAGYFPFRSENAKDSGKKDLKEFYHYYSARSELPEGVRRFTPELFGKMSALGAELLSWIEQNTPAEVLRKFSMPLSEMIRGSQDTLLRPIHYPPLTGIEEEGAVRAAAHEDINLITLLPAATAPGLQVKDMAGNWHDVPCDIGTIVINSGDMLREASGGYYPSTTHRVVNPRGPDAKLPRYSMPLFLHARQEVRLSDRYTAGAYLQQRLREIGLLAK
ncbi:MAG: 2-oxoglutarate and iron-dependent oxygenase domain-containing protein [Oligoflexia bacterium]|nr:2-oxoglutarate and iron-dependent oxygenase domain-containing protein [Oligoflexia bacterium]